MNSLLAYTLDSDIALRIGIALVEVIVLLCAVIFFYTIFLRITLVYHARNKQKLINTWRPILTSAIAEIPETLPTLNTRFVEDFILEWNSLYDKVSGDCHENLTILARQLNIHKFASKMLISVHPKTRLLGVITLGNMKINSAWPILKSMASSDISVLSLAAFRALVNIDSHLALEQMFPMIMQRKDWPPTLVARVLKGTRSSEICQLLFEACEHAELSRLPGLVSYVHALNCPNSTQLFKQVLKRNVDDRVISMFLQEVSDPSALELVKHYLDSPIWHIRVHAVGALGRIASVEEIPLLEKMLSDGKWWVRYRAAQALVGLPFVKATYLESLLEKLKDRFAQDILRQAMVEKDFI